MAFTKISRLALVVAMSVPLLAHTASASRVHNVSPLPSPTHHVYIIGDSLTVGPQLFASLSRRVTRTRNWNSTLVNAKVGRTIPQGITVLQKARFRNPTAIVVALGTNDVLSRREASYPARAIDDFMRAAQGKPVLWMNIEFDRTRPDWRSRGVRFNRELRKATSRWPNLQIADWDRHFSPKGPSRFIQDGIHLTVTGYKTRTSFMVAQLNSWSLRLWNQSTTTTTTTVPATSSTEPNDTTSVPESSTTIDPDSSATTIPDP
jgi:lysophospholipase L1-like esterase